MGNVGRLEEVECLGEMEVKEKGDEEGEKQMMVERRDGRNCEDKKMEQKKRKMFGPKILMTLYQQLFHRGGH